ncbi:MAG: helix-turn-helix domain-containing protein [Chloroflexota bacterium]|nr:helix-turn-helix domain-containing protein [Chloroflexota bacterium]
MKTIRQLREERGWTQLHLAVRLGVTPVTIYNWEQGRSQPRVAQFRQLARLFDVSMDDVALVGEGRREAGTVSAPPAAGPVSDDR